MVKMRNLFLQSQCFKIFQLNFFNQVEKRRYDIYGNNLCLPYREIYFVKIFAPCRLCGVMNFSVYWNDDYTSIVFFIQFFNTWSQLLKNVNFFRRNAEFIFAIGFQTIFRGTDFCDWLIQNYILRIKLLRFWAKITKISSAIIYSGTIYDHKNFCP